MQIQLSDHFTYKKLFRFVIPSIIMMIFTSIYGVVDGLFVSNFAGKVPFAAVNLIIPFPMLLAAFGFMLGTGGSAIVAKTLGEGKKELANRYFSMMVIVAIVAGVLITILGMFFVTPVAKLLGAEGEMLTYCTAYGRILFLFIPFFMLQNLFQSFLITAERPDFGLKVTVAAGVTNILLDFLLVGVLKQGVVGAAIATGLSQIVGGLIPLFCFMQENKSKLRLCRTRVEGRVLWKACINGSSELMTNISMSFISMLYNFQLMRIAGEDGVAAFGVIMYVNFIFISVFLGYSIGSAPIVGYHYGAGNHEELRNMLKKSLKIMMISGILMLILAVVLSPALSRIFVGYDEQLYAMTKRGFALYSLSFLFTGVNIYGSAFFTALGDGIVSAIISFLRTLLFQMAAVLILPVFFGLDGVWLAIFFAELFALAVTVTFLAAKRKKYRY